MIALLLGLLAGSVFAAPLTHGWENALAASFADFGYSILSPAQAADVASHYKVVGLEKCTGNAQRVDSVAGIYESARLLKLADPTVKALFYMSTINDHLECYYSAHAAFLARPDWWLRDDSGAPINVTASPPVPVLDFLNQEARAWWVSIPLGGANTSRLIDGLLADQAGLWNCGSRVSASRCAAINAARSVLVREAQDMFTALNNGTVLQNGISMYSSTPDYNMYSLPDADGIMAEHFASFESIIRTPASGSAPATWRYDFALVGKFLAAVQNASAAGKTVVLAAWPGPITGVSGPWPSFANGLQPRTTAGWRDALLYYHAFALAGWATVASERVFLQYQGWYNGFINGVVGCGGDANTCGAPSPWYADLYRPLGEPLGPAVPSGDVCTSAGCVPTAWTRQFQFATSFLDLVNPNASGLTWYSVSSTPSASASPSASPSPQSTPPPPGAVADAGGGLSVGAAAAVSASAIVFAVAAAACEFRRARLKRGVAASSSVATVNSLASAPNKTFRVTRSWRGEPSLVASSAAPLAALRASSVAANAASYRWTAGPTDARGSGQLAYV